MKYTHLSLAPTSANKFLTEMISVSTGETACTRALTLAWETAVDKQMWWEWMVKEKIY